MLKSAIRELTAFDFFVGHRSAIEPLGGSVQGPDPKYVFHTQYHEYRPGPVVFRVVFDELSVSFGELEIHLNAWMPHSGKNALKATGARFSMVELQDNEGSFEVSVYAVKGVSYGLYGFFPNGSDARASEITITAEEQGIAEDDNIPAEAFEPTRFGTGDLLQSPRLIDGEGRPSLADPVSQLMTPDQLCEAAYTACQSELGLSGATPAEIWQKAFILQVMKRYGFFASGARGLCLGDQDAEIAALLAEQGNPILLGVDALRASLLAERDIPTGPYLASGGMDLADLAADLRGFDFLWSVGSANRMGGEYQARSFVENAMRCLRPGGLAIHVIDIMSPSSNIPIAPPVSDTGFAPVPLKRDEVIRMAVTLMSRSNDVAQMNFGDAITRSEGLAAGFGRDPGDIVPFGLVIRKGPG